MKTLCVVLVLFSACFVSAEDILLSLLTTNSELVVLRINFSANKYTIVDRAVFSLTAVGGLTAIAPLAGSAKQRIGNFQVAWNQKDSTNKTKLYTMTVTPGLDAVGAAKKNKPTLTSYYNLNILPDGDRFSIDFKNNVFVRNRSSNGNLGAGSKKAFSVPTSLDPFNTNFVKLSGLASASNVQDDDIYSCSVVYNDVLGDFGIVFNDDLLPGDEVIYRFSSDVVDGYCEGDLEKDDLWFLFFERISSARTGDGNAVTTLSLKRRKIDGATLVPEGSIATLVPKKTADRLGTIPFFNMFTVASDRASGAHIFYLEQANSCNSTVLKGFHFNSQNGKRNSPFSTLIPCSDPLLGDTFLYGLAAFTE